MLAKVRVLISRVHALFSMRDLDRDFGEELRHHLSMLTDENIRRGMKPDEARRVASIELGNPVHLRESHREQRTFPWLESLVQDIRFALRMFAKDPGFTAIAVLTLALGIGVNAILFSAYDAVALKPLPIANPARVVRFERWFQRPSLGPSQYLFSYPEFLYCRDHNTNFSGLVAASWVLPVQGLLPGAQAPRRLTSQLVSANYFTEFGIRPRLGRTFAATEDQAPGGDAVIVISYSFWRRAFENSPQAVGQVVTLNNVPFTIVGIAPEEFTGTSVTPQVPDFWAPLSMQPQLVPGPDWLHDPQQRFLQIYARLKPPVSRLSAQPEADLLIRQFASTYTELEKTAAVTLQRTTYFPNTDDIRFRALVGGMMLIVGLILFVACVNVGNMLFARGAVRQREISTRRALGASRGRIIRQLLAESVLLAILGGTAGLILSTWSSGLISAFLQRNASLLGGDFSAVNFHPDWHVIAYALAISIVAGTLLGLSPALRLAGQDLASALKTEVGSLGKTHSSRARNALIGTQVAASVLLLAMAGLLTRGLSRSQAAEPGFDARGNFWLIGNLVNLGIDPANLVATESTLVERMRARREFASVTLGSVPYLGTWSPPIKVGQQGGQTLGSYASENYFDQLRIPLIRGRGFTAEESRSGARLAVISESLARSYWPHEDPIGQTLQLNMDFGRDVRTFQVIGIAKDVRFANVTRVDPGHVYVPVRTSRANGIGIMVRLHGDPRDAIAAADTVVAQTEKQPFPDLSLLNLDRELAARQRTLVNSLTTLAGVLAALALALAGVGIYGVLAYLVSRRTREIGVRIALGATPGAIVKNVVLVGLRPVFAGMLVGIAFAGALSMLLHQTLIFPGSMDLLYGVPFYDPLTFIGLFCFIVIIAAVAGAVPAHRAIRVDPVSAMRCE